MHDSMLTWILALLLFIAVVITGEWLWQRLLADEAALRDDSPADPDSFCPDKVDPFAH